MQGNPVISRDEWITARKALLDREKELTRLRDAVNAERLALPWVKVDKTYVFDTPHGKKTLADLFDGRSQLVIYHFMFGPDWEAGCPGCSFLADHLGGALPHLEHHDVTLTMVSRAPLEKLETYKRRMDWHLPWVSSHDNDFNFDYHVSFRPSEIASGHIFYNYSALPASEGLDELPGLSAFARNEAGEIFHTYSGYARGGEDLLGALMVLDRAPKGRNEKSTLDFVRRHDEYDAAPQVTCCHS
ncbi:DUF899 domain-containing protein [Chelatococcus asaccharovorans]|uniref:DUF899 domain-containing protein n=1 Tax=Chelatococcus asaccharovorans TaxID=28210 RepID=UPI00224C6FC2|nr:thioredoxin family protein [Chelatococcus asaccharovorans]CAH1649025.1 conserved hypothetical protein [Chelatococcus asaccharovorans]CAH1687230.1 conserved hypothetical protein [Chelatococcus asaccharovorans]